MGLDIRTPIGLMFSVFGVILAGYGFFGNPEIYARSLGINVNLYWGLALLLFGAIMLALGKFGRQARGKTGADSNRA